MMVPLEAPFMRFLRLSGVPSDEWIRVFLENWDFPPKFSSMHRPGIARVEGDRLILDGTRVDEIEKYHAETLKLVVERTNQIVASLAASRRQKELKAERVVDEHKQRAREVAKRLKFD